MILIQPSPSKAINMLDPKDPKCVEKCKKLCEQRTEEEVIDALLRSGCSAHSRERLKERLKKGLIAEFCGCYCSNYYPFAASGDGQQTAGKPTPENLPGWVMKMRGL